MSRPAQIFSLHSDTARSISDLSQGLSAGVELLDVLFPLRRWRGRNRHKERAIRTSSILQYRPLRCAHCGWHYARHVRACNTSNRGLHGWLGETVQRPHQVLWAGNLSLLREWCRTCQRSPRQLGEPTSVTPFSIPVCERAIHALAVSLARALDENLVATPQTGLSSSTRRAIEKIILTRVGKVAHEELPSAKLYLEKFLDDWDRVRPQYYGTFNQTPPPGVEPMLWPVGKPRPDHTWSISRDTPSSMRNVDAECEAWALKEYPGSGQNPGTGQP